MESSIFFTASGDLGLSETQKNNIGMLVHALYNNPKVLYAPNNSAANIVMNKVYGFNCSYFLVYLFLGFTKA